MKIKSLYLKDFLSFNETKIDFDNLNVIVGPNNSGKTNLFRAIDFTNRFLNFYGSKSSQTNLPPLRPLYASGDAGRPFSLEFMICLDDDEVEAISDFMKLSAISHLTDNANFYNASNSIPDIELFKEIFSNDIRLVINAKINALFAPTCYLQIDNMLFHDLARLDIDNNHMKVNIRRLNLGMLLSKNASGDTIDREWLVKKMVDDPPAVVDISSFDFTSLDRIEKLKPLLSKLRNFIEPRVGHIENVNLTVLFDIIFGSTVISNLDHAESALDGVGGTEKSVILFNLKNSIDNTERKTYLEIQEKFKELTGHAFDIGVETIQPQNGETGKIKARIYIDAFPEEFAPRGLLELVGLLTVILMKKRIVILDEPAVNLHPTIQKRLLGILEESENQTIIITHSPYFVSMHYLPSVMRFVRENSITKIYRPEFNDDEKDKAVKEMERNPKIISALFSNGVVLVEGDDEEAALPVWFKKDDFDLEAENIQLVNVRGHGSFKTFTKIISRWNVPSCIVCDKKADGMTRDLQNRFVLEENDFMCIINGCNTSCEVVHDKDPVKARKWAEERDPPYEIKEICKGIKNWSKNSKL